MEKNKKLYFTSDKSFFAFVRKHMLEMGIATLTVIRGIVSDSEAFKPINMEGKTTDELAELIKNKKR